MDDSVAIKKLIANEKRMAILIEHLVLRQSQLAEAMLRHVLYGGMKQNNVDELKKMVIE